MAKLTDPDSYSIAVNATATTEEVEVQTGLKTIELRIAGNLDDTAPGKTSGGTAKSVYSFLKEEWLANSTLRRFRFPIKMIFEGSFIWINGWAPANDQTRDLFRDAGFQEQVSGQINACMISLGAINAPLVDLAYYTGVFGPTAAVLPYDKTGEINENIDITGKTTYQKSFLREQGKTYAEYELLSEQGLSVIGFQAYSFPLTNLLDSKIVETDGNIDSNTPYTNMEINYIKGIGFTTWADSTVYSASAVVQSLTGRWFFTETGGTSSGTDVGDDVGVTDWIAYAGEVLIGSIYYAFNRIIDAATATDTQAYSFMQRELRQTGDINDDTITPAAQGGSGAINGNIAELLAEYVGDTLKMKPGVAIVNFDANSTNNINHQPITVDTGGLDANGVPLASATVSFPFKSAGNFVFSANYVSQPDIDTVYTVYFNYTRSQSAATIATTSSAADVTTFTDSGSGMTIGAGEYFTVSGFTTNPTNNGLYLETGGSPTNASVTATKQDGVTVIDETEGDTVGLNSNPFESPGAIIVNNNAGTPMDAQISAATTPFDFDYTNNNQGGRTPATPAQCTIVAIAKDGAEYIDASFTITAATGINVPVNGGDERNYSNPA